MASGVVVAIGLVAILSGVIVDASGTAPRLAGSNLLSNAQYIATVPPHGRLCQPREFLPADTGALQLRMSAFSHPGPPVRAEVSLNGRQITAGSVRAGWSEGDVPIPVARVTRAVAGVTVCLWNEGAAKIAIGGAPVPPSVAAQVATRPQEGLARIEYIRPGRESWWQLFPTIVHRFSLGKSHWLGGWTLLLAAGLLLGAAALSVLTILRQPARAALVCGAVTLLVGSAWSLITPPFHVPDEISHVGYAQYLSETGKLPKLNSGVQSYSPEEQQTLAALGFYAVIGQPRNRPPLSNLQEQAIRAIDHQRPDRAGAGDESTAAGNPPLYYGLETIPYWISPSHNLLDRLVLMRLLSVLLAAGTVVVIFEFLLTLLPAVPWAWPVGALVAGLQPTFGFISGGVNNDNLLFLLSACTFLLIARAFRHGLTRRRAVVLGAVCVAGVLTKLTFLALLPPVGFALVALVLRAAPRRRKDTAVAGLIAVAVGLAPFVLYLLLASAIWHHSLLQPGQVSGTVGHTAQGSLRGALSFMWQLFLPRLPIFNDQIPGFGLRSIWLAGFLGRFGWLDYGFPAWVYNLGWYLAIAVSATAVAGLVRMRAAVRRRWLELACYVLAVTSLAVLIGIVDYQAVVTGSPRFEQGRYLLPLLALYAAVGAIAARAAGPRWGRVVGAALVMAALAHTVFAQLLTISRFYG
jgi:Predicted membrane protein (DUF2142)